MFLSLDLRATGRRGGLHLTGLGAEQTTPKLAKKARSSLDTSFSYLGGNAFGRDKKGRVVQDDGAMSADMQAAGQGGEGNDYTPFVCYEFEIN